MNICDFPPLGNIVSDKYIQPDSLHTSVFILLVQIEFEDLLT